MFVCFLKSLCAHWITSVSVFSHLTLHYRSEVSLQFYCEHGSSFLTIHNELEHTMFKLTLIESMATDTTTTVIIRVLMSILSTVSPRGKLGYKNTPAVQYSNHSFITARQYSGILLTQSPTDHGNLAI